MNSYFEQLIKLYPLLKDEEQDRIKILISGKEFIIQNRQVKILKLKIKIQFLI